MKFIMKHGKSEKDIKNLRQEIEILRQLRHEHIIQMLDAFETKTDFCVVTGGLREGAHKAEQTIPTHTAPDKGQSKHIRVRVRYLQSLPRASCLRF